MRQMNRSAKSRALSRLWRNGRMVSATRVSNGWLSRCGRRTEWQKKRSANHVSSDRCERSASENLRAGLGVFLSQPRRSHPRARFSLTDSQSQLTSQGQRSRHDSGKKTAGKEDSSPPHIVFNGPVFFGYSAEQVADLLQSVNLGNV